jgi:hypothetical protein
MQTGNEQNFNDRFVDRRWRDEHVAAVQHAEREEILVESRVVE